MLVVMPIVGRLYNKVSPRLVVAFGIILFAYTAWLMGHYTLETSTRDVVQVLVIQGVAFSCLFIPLTTMALSTIPRHRLSDATGLNSLLRQTGGSVGLALFATMLSRFATKARGDMLPHFSMSSPAMAARVAAIQRMLQGRGLDSFAARQHAAQMIDGQLRQQAMVISFEKLFYLSGILFLCVLPLVFFLKMPKDAEKIDIHVEM
jgi:DHA2 family multidrug resistance protein